MIKLGKPDPALVDKLESSILGETPLHFSDTDSSLVEEAAYDPGQQLLRVTLKAGKTTKVYRYGDFSPSSWVDFYQAPSKGRFFSAYIRPHYAGVLES